MYKYSKSKVIIKVLTLYKYRVHDLKIIDQLNKRVTLSQVNILLYYNIIIINKYLLNYSFKMKVTSNQSPF